MSVFVREPISRNYLNLKLLLFNALHSPADRQTLVLRRRSTRPEQQQLLHVSSLPLSSLFLSAYCKIYSCLLSHPTPLNIAQDTKLLNSRALFDCNLGFKGSLGLSPFVGLRKDLIFRPRRFCSVGGYDDYSDVEGEVDDVGEGESGSVKSKADLREVERVCKVIEELSAWNRKMVSGLNECGIKLSHDLVVDVLDRFKHARKPAFRFFCWAGNQEGYVHDSRTYNVMMRILGKARQFETMVTLLEEMGQKGVLNIETFQIAIQSFGASQERRKAVAMIELMKKYKFKVDVDTINCLLDALGRVKLGEEAQLLFGELEERFTPNLQTYTVLLNGWCKVKNIMEAGRVWNEMNDKGFKPDVVAYNTMLRGFLDDKELPDAMKLFEVMKTEGPTPNVQSYSIMIRYLCKQKLIKRAVGYFEEMASYGCQPDAAVYTCLITRFGNMNKMDKVFGLLKQMKERGCPPDAQMYNALIKLMTRRKMQKNALRIYTEMLQNGIHPTIDTYNILIKSFFQTKKFGMGFAAWEDMKQRGCCPNYNSYDLLIRELMKQGRSVDACKYLEEMIEKGMEAPQIDYDKFKADCSRAGKHHVLEELAQKMKLSGKLEDSSFLFLGCAEMNSGVKSRQF
ncbi:hypothetical protein ACET3Z_022283 [Daucus carota]